MTDLATDTNRHQQAAQQSQRRALHSPLIDFLLLGGASIFILPIAALIPQEFAPNVLMFAAFISLWINYPHFAHSYQIFYRDFANKLKGNGYAQHLRWRYAFAGIIAPIIIAGAFAVSYAAENKQWLGACVGAMTFFVGWHYVKQGYGILIVDSVMNRSFFNDQEKKIFKLNAYACWLFFFILTSHTLRDRNFMGLQYYLPHVPDTLLYLFGAAMLITSVLAIYAAITSIRRNRSKPIPINGFMAYILSIYIWLGARYNPIVLYLIPAFHSLQYLAVVWRYELNRNSATPPGGYENVRRRMIVFVGMGIILGVMGFEAIPRLLDQNITYQQSAYGTTLFTAMIWVFINIHHYFLDNVMWRKDNPDVGKHLFGAR
jgi:hypothetical protein